MKYTYLTFGLCSCLALLLFIVLLPKKEHKRIDVAFLGVMSGLSIALGILESFIPDFIIPGVKIGFPNIVVLYLFCYKSKKEALFASLLRVFIVSLLRGNLLQMGGLMSFSGALLSYLVMLLLSLLYKKASPIFLSCLGALSHGVGQLIVAALFFTSYSVFYYYPLMGLLSLAAGVFSGIIVILLERRLGSFVN